MKAYITHYGVLTIEPENETETFALRRWFAEANCKAEIENKTETVFKPSTIKIEVICND